MAVNFFLFRQPHFAHKREREKKKADGRRERKTENDIGRKLET